ncbi:MAG: hypothetical protein J6Z26_04870 [Bacteroidales bacterium]|nr:hypothetical protein [Bacteroidales bacterium]
MTKKVLLLAMALGMTMGVFSQERVAAEKQAVEERCEDFFNNIENAFKKHKSSIGPNWHKVGDNGKQFIVDDLAKFGVKAKTIQKQFDALESDSKIDVKITRNYMGISEAKGNNAEKNCYTTTHEVKVNAKKGNATSTVRNRVVIKWEVDYKAYDPSNHKWTADIKGTKVKKTPVNIVSISTQAIDLISSEKSTIASNINAAIREWYGNINNNFQHNKAGLNRGECNPIVIKEDLSKKSFVSTNDISSRQPITVKSAPDFVVYSNNPYNHINPGEEFKYTNPEAFWKVQPTFNVTVDMETFQVTNIEPSYKNTFKAPETDGQKMAKLNAAASVARNYANKVNQYAQASKGKEKTQMKNEILSMFANPKANSIQFSLIKKNGTEMQKYIDKPTTPKSYIEHLPACEFSLDKEFAYFGENTDEVIVDYIQTYKQIYPEKYKGNKYADKTHKSIYLKYDAEKDTWLINKITAEKGSTVLIENE